VTNFSDRRRLIQLALMALPTPFALGRGGAAVTNGKTQMTGKAGSEHDFDFFLGSWNVHHRRLKKRMVGSDDWEEFEGTTTCQALLGGIVNANDSVTNRPDGSYRGLGLRAFDVRTNTWADWYLDARDPLQIDPPGIGRFVDRIGTFLSDDVFEGKPIKVRGVFSSLSPMVARWEQAFSADNGVTWESNWVMRYTRI
jgi:hypothetical protein